MFEAAPIADNGSCVILGRAADYVLRNYKNGIRIFIYAPFDYRMRRVMEVYGDSAEKTKKNIRRSNEARAAAVKNSRCLFLVFIFSQNFS